MGIKRSNDQEQDNRQTLGKYLIRIRVRVSVAVRVQLPMDQLNELRNIII